MLIASRNGFAVRKRISAKSYVQDGLVAMWDGIENAGWGVHDPNATVWKDLSNNGYDLSPVANPPVWSPTAFSGDGTSRKMWSREISAVNSSGATIEVGLHLKGGSNAWYVQNRSVVSTSAVKWFQIIFYLPSSQQYGRLGFGHEAYGDASFNIPLDVDFVIAISADSQGTRKYINGSFEENKVTDYSANILGGNALCIGAWGDIGSAVESPMPLGGKIYDIRLYNRVLTADEIAHNYAIDKIRFNLP